MRVVTTFLIFSDFLSIKKERNKKKTKALRYSPSHNLIHHFNNFKASVKRFLARSTSLPCIAAMANFASSTASAMSFFDTVVDEEGLENQPLLLEGAGAGARGSAGRRAP